jgi:hypothetical protein
MKTKNLGDDGLRLKDREKMKAKILAQYYADVGSFTTKEQSRYSLDTLRIEPHPEKGVVIVATDGHTMGVFHDEGGECPAEGISLLYNESIAEMCKTERMLEVNDDGSASIINRGREEVRFSDIESDGKFPDWRLPFPKWTTEVKRTDYNPEYIERCAKMCGDRYPQLAIWSGAEIGHAKQGPTVIRPYERDDCFFLVMPMEQDGDTYWPELLDLLRRKDHAELDTDESAKRPISDDQQNGQASLTEK